MILVLTIVFTVLAARSTLVATRITRYALRQPRLPALLLIAALVDIFAVIATGCGVLAINAVAMLLAGVRLIPSPVPTLLLVGLLLLASAANEATRWWLRRKSPKAEQVP